jgi:hypothetical protein
MAASSYYTKTLIELITPPKIPDGRERIDTIPGAKHAAQLLFSLIAEHHGKEEAYRILAKFGAPPSASRMGKIKNLGLLDMYDLMRPKPNVQQLAFRLAAENKKLPRAEQRGTGSTNVMTLDRHIRRLLRERRERGEGKEHDEV